MARRTNPELIGCTSKPTNSAEEKMKSDMKLSGMSRLLLGRSMGGYFVSCSQACTVLAMSIAMVIGPTPPGTGVMAAQRAATAS